jgi:cytochrome c biogenesis protein CcmG/thiol:disulfide interchange protein DsbE
VLKNLSAEGVTILGVNYKDKPEAALRFLKELGNPYTATGADDSGRMGLDWGLYGVPETFVIDGNGTVILRHAGPITANILEERIRPALAQAAGE